MDLHLRDAFPHLSGCPLFWQHELYVGIIHPTDFVIEPKLLYYAQGIYLALSGKKLFSDNLVAWAHGPVVVDVYHEYCSNGSRGIEYNESLRPKEKYSKEERNVLEQVYNYFGQYSAWKLRNMTHEERPWLETPQNHVISPKLIKEYFLEEYVRESA